MQNNIQDDSLTTCIHYRNGQAEIPIAQYILGGLCFHEITSEFYLPFNRELTLSASCKFFI